MSTEVMKQAVKDLNEPGAYVYDTIQQVITTLRQAIEQAPPTRQWIGLTEDEAHLCFKSANVWHAVEAKLKEKNHAQSN